MPTSEQSGQRQRTGRALPATIDEFTNTQLNLATRQLILECLKLVTSRYASLTAMIKDALDSPNRPKWAVGTSGSPEHVRSCKSDLSKCLGRAATRCPDWVQHVEWIVRTCVEPGRVDEVLATLAGLWCEATGQARPPGYTGALRDQPELIDPAQAPDDTTRARLLADQATRLTDEVAALDNLVAERDRTIRELDSHIQRLDADNDALRRQLAQTAHCLAITVAHLATGHPRPHPDALYKGIGLTADPMLARLLTQVPDQGRFPGSRWLAVYLNVLLRAGHDRTGGAIPYARYQSVSREHIDAVLAGRAMPSPYLASRVWKHFPAARRIMDAISARTATAANTPTKPMRPFGIPQPRMTPHRRPWPYVTVQELIARERPDTQPD